MDSPCECGHEQDEHEPGGPCEVKGCRCVHYGEAMTTKTSNLLPCPFCGHPPQVEPWHGGGPRKTIVSCMGDYCRVAPQVTGGNRETAIRRWNTRDGRVREPRRG